ncbi:DUF1330 domain-containing protein [Catenulispora rubra]|uniref:DUF1330 domain-containing protein n=1 Tax=Catenulispora rubra TaxID=280293 RepID=UPI0018921C96|nr:DUF1330 domain-containing protein [Catenulispora rubra]
MSAYALANVRSVELCPDIVEYLERIQGTMDPFGGRFIFHGGEKEVVEGSWAQDLILIEFPDPESVRGWWNSPEYQAIKHLRTDHMAADIVLFDTLPRDYQVGETAAKLAKLM